MYERRISSSNRSSLRRRKPGPSSATRKRVLEYPFEFLLPSDFDALNRRRSRTSKISAPESRWPGASVNNPVRTSDFIASANSRRQPVPTMIGRTENRTRRYALKAFNFNVPDIVNCPQARVHAVWPLSANGKPRRVSLIQILSPVNALRAAFHNRKNKVV